VSWESLTPGPGSIAGPPGPPGPQGPAGSLAAHHVTHEPGGTDAIVGAAWLNQPNNFTQTPQQVSTVIPEVRLIETNRAADQRVFRIAANNQLYFIASNDAITVNQGLVSMDRTGVLTANAGLGTTPLNGSQITSGTVPDARLSANVALKNIDNRFVAQTLASGNFIVGTNSALYFSDTASPADARVWRVINYGDGFLRVEALTDAISAVQGQPLVLARTGAVTVGTALTVGTTVTINGGTAILTGGIAEIRLIETAQAANAQMFRILAYQGLLQFWACSDNTAAQTWPLSLMRGGGVLVHARLQIGNTQGGGLSPSFPAWRNTGAQMECVLGDNTNWALVRAACFVSVASGNNLVDLTCGATNFTAGVLVTGGFVDCRSYIISTGVMYPGRIDIAGGAQQTSWYLASHGSYGLYSNTGLYLAGSLTVGADISCSTITTTSGAAAAAHFFNCTVDNMIVCTAINASYSGTAINATAGSINAAVGLTVGTGVTFMGLSAQIGSYNGKLQMQMDCQVRPYGIVISNSNGTAGLVYMAYLNAAAGLAGAISQISQTQVAYQTTSDARLKQDLGRTTDLSSLRQIVIHDFLWKHDGSRDRGIFAQEGHALFPRAIAEGTDEVGDDGITLVHPWMIDHSKFVADLIAGWQAHDAEIACLRAELATLKQRMA
jgi:hypothetical protein